MPTSKKNGADNCLELDCTAHQLTNGSISKSYAGTIFRFCCGSFTEAELATLEQASQSGSDVRLLLPDSNVRLVGIHIERLDTGSVRIGGNVVELSVYRSAPHVLFLPSSEQTESRTLAMKVQRASSKARRAFAARSSSAAEGDVPTMPT